MKIFNFSGFLLCLLLAFLCQAEQDTKPQQIHTHVNSDVSLRAVSWVTIDPTASSTVQYGTDDQMTEKVEGESEKFINPGDEGRVMYLHNAVIKDLKPETTYYYRVGDPKDGWSDIFSFKTLPEERTALNIAMFGDLGVVNAQTLELLETEAKNRAYDMIIHVGDMGYDLDQQQGRKGDEFMNQMQNVATAYPYQVCIGNHEAKFNFTHYTKRYGGMSTISNTGHNWWFSYDVSYVHFVAIDTELYFYGGFDKQLQAHMEFLENDLKNVDRKKTPWVIVYGHRPLYCSNIPSIRDCTGEAKKLRRGIEDKEGNYRYGLEDVLMKHKVDIYFCGHEHAYERTFPVYKGQFEQHENHIYRNPKLPVHIIAGAAGNPEEISGFDDVLFGPWSAARSGTYGYGHLTTVNETHLYWKQYLNKSTEDVDDLWIIKDAEPEKRAEPWAELPFQNELFDCDHYTYAACKFDMRDPEYCLDISSCSAYNKVRQAFLQNPHDINSISSILPPPGHHMKIRRDLVIEH